MLRYVTLIASLLIISGCELSTEEEFDLSPTAGSGGDCLCFRMERSVQREVTFRGPTSWGACCARHTYSTRTRSGNLCSWVADRDRDLFDCR